MNDDLWLQKFLLKPNVSQCSGGRCKNVIRMDISVFNDKHLAILIIGHQLIEPRIRYIGINIDRIFGVILIGNVV